MLAPRRGWPMRLALTMLAALTVLTVLPTGSASAAPGMIDEDGGRPELQQKLAEASRGYLEAKGKLERSVAQQGELAARLRDVESRLSVAVPAAAEILAAAYRTGGSLQTASLLLASGSPGGFVDRAARLKMVANRNERQLRELIRLRADLAAGKAAIDAEVANQERQVSVMAKRKQEAERALAAFGGQPVRGPDAGSPPTTQQPPAAQPPAPQPPTTKPRPAPPGPPPAQPAPRRPDGTWPPEPCRLDDPTTSGCITARTLHALRQAQSAGYTRFVSCFRSGGSGEHPRGRACDYAAQPKGFGGVATGGDRAYGNSLANYFVGNAGRLGVLYVIWFQQIWLPSSGWRAYRGGRGDPSSEHTNHVHLSMF